MIIIEKLREWEREAEKTFAGDNEVFIKGVKRGLRDCIQLLEEEKVNKKIEKELKNDLVASWNEVNEALTSLEQLTIEEIGECLDSIKERLEKAQDWLGKYVNENDVL